MTDYKPEPERLLQDIHFLREYWTPRNSLVEESREYLSGRNKIAMPQNTKYKIKPVHTYMLASMVNEKMARYLPQPILQVVVSNALSPEEREQSTLIERALNRIQYEMEIRGDGDVWGRVILDAILLDGGVERIDRAPQTFWPDLPLLQQTGKSSELLRAYKENQGPPLRSTYVPLEYTFPEYDGSAVVNNFEFEQRNLRGIIDSEEFDSNSRAELRNLAENNKIRDIVIVHHVTREYHCLYAVKNSRGGYTNELRNDRVNIWQTTGELLYLYDYRHGLGRVPYNYVAGRFGGWKTAEGGIIDIGKGILHLNSITDELATQIYTNIRATKWPTFKFFVDSEKRGYQEKGPPKPPTVEEGQDITMFVGEDLLPLVEPSEDPVLAWFYNMIEGRASKLGGNPVLFGENQPGVRTGYQQALQISEAESTDNKLEANLAQGAIQRGVITMLHIRQLDEEVFAHEVAKIEGKKYGGYVNIKPEWLSILPRLDAKVRATKPVDFLAALRAAKEASDDRQGKGALLDDMTILEEVLARDEPDIIKRRVRIEAMQNKVLNSGVLEKRVGDALNIKLAQDTAPTVDLATLAQIDPALAQAVQQVAPQSIGQGGINPQTLGGVAGSAAGLPPGSVPTDSQPEQRLGEEVTANLASNL